MMLDESRSALLEVSHVQRIDTVIEGVRYVQQPLGNPHERNGWQIQTSPRQPFANVWTRKAPAQPGDESSMGVCTAL